MPHIGVVRVELGKAVELAITLGRREPAGDESADSVRHRANHIGRVGHDRQRLNLRNRVKTPEPYRSLHSVDNERAADEPSPR